MIDIDLEAECIIKEYIEGDTVFDIVRKYGNAEEYLPQVREMADKAKSARLNIDYFPTNFVVSKDLIYYVDYECNPYMVRDGLLWYIDYECNGYMEEWNFENWGIRYWSLTPEFRKYLKEHEEK